MFSGCDKKGNGDVSNYSFTEQEIKAITDDYQSINDMVKDLRQLNEITDEAINDIIEKCNSLPTVESATKEENAIIIKIKNGGIIGWLLETDFVIPPYISETSSEELSSMLRSSSSTSTNKNMPNIKTACLINTVTKDESKADVSGFINSLALALGKEGYVCDVVTTNANRDFFGKNLSSYGLIYDVSHGVCTNGRTWLSTGEELSNISLILQNPIDWISDKICILNNREKRNGVYDDYPYVYISDKFINDQYNKTFPNSLIYLIACEGMKNNQLGTVFNSKGAGVTIGWTKTVEISPYSGYSLIIGMLSGYKLEDVYNKYLSNDQKNDKTTGAQMVYYPQSGGSLYLVDKESKASISFDYPINNQTCDKRTIEIKGTCKGFDVIKEGRITVNGASTLMVFVNDSVFNQEINIKSGENIIQATCWGQKKFSNDLDIEATDVTIKVIGNFAPLDLSTQLRWNTNDTDVDLHLLPPGYGTNSLFSSYDCYYGNTRTSWGAELDIDNTWGYGPEHITIPTVTIPGTYMLCVHYYAARQAPFTDVWVTAASYESEPIEFGPHRMINTDDIWVVCYIEYPSGNIIPIDQTTLRSSTIFTPPQKQRK